MNLTIKSKLIGGFTIILVLLISIVFFMTNKLSESNNRMNNIVNLYSPKINLSNELMIAALNAARNEKDIILEKNIIQQDYSKDKIYRALDVIDKKTIELQELVDEKGKIILDEFQTIYTNYKIHLNEIIALAMKNKEDEALKISIESGLHARGATIGLIQRLIDKNEKSMENAKIENSASYKDCLLYTSDAADE